MDIDKEKQAQAMAKARQSLLQAEIKREEARQNQNIALFLQEEFNVLLNDEFVEKLAQHIIRQYRGDQRKTAINLLEKLEKSICNESEGIRERSLMVVLILSEHIYTNNIRELSSIIARITANWLYFETEFIAGFEPVCHQLQRLILEMLSTQQWYEAEQLIVTLNKISNKSLLKNNLIYGVVSRVHDKLAEADVLDIMVNAYLGESSQRKDVVENILLNMGKQGSQFLIQRLTHSNDKEERLALLELIPRIGEVSVPVLASYLEGDHPWYVIRNIIMIVSRLGNDQLFNDVKPHLSHEDIRVQQQVVNCIEVLGGEQTEQRLLEALFTINDELKVHLIDQLVQFSSPEIETAMLDLFDQRNNFSSHVSDFLISKLCNKLTSYPSSRTISSLLDLVDERKERYGEADTVVKAATDALRVIEQKTSGDTIFSQRIEDDPINELIEEEVLAQIPADPADLSESYGGSGLSDIFVETLTDTLTDQKPEAKEQSSPMFQPHHSQDHHLMVWSGFYEQLDTKEANQFFSTLVPETLNPGDVIVEQGAEKADLYFIDHGYADVSYSNGSGNVHFTPVQAGEIIGGDISFKDQPWPVSIHAQTDLQVRILRQSQHEEIHEKLPDLLPKLKQYCKRYDVIPFLVQHAATETADEEYPEIVIRSSSLFIAEDEQRIDAEITGMFTHAISGGFNITIAIANSKNAGVSVGHQITAELVMADESTQTCFGIIAGSGYYDGSEEKLHVHVKLYHPLQDGKYRCSAIDIM